TEELTVSLTRPVYNMSDYANTSELLGVAGIDVPIQTLKNLSPYQALGPNAYAFIINHNGFLVMHPRLGRQLSYLLGPPHIDLMDVEEDSKTMQHIRNSMVQGKSDTNIIPGKLHIDDSHRVLYSEIQYDYVPIHNATYSLGLVTRRRFQHLEINDDEIEFMDPPNTTYTVVAPWPFCRGRERVNHAEHMNALMNDIFSGQKQSCKSDLVQGLLWSLTWTQPLLDRWASERLSSDDILGLSVFTRFGVGRFYPESQRPGATAWRDPMKNPALKRGEINRDVSVIPHRKGVYLSAPVLVKKNRTEVIGGVVGVNVTAKYLRDSFIQHMNARPEGKLLWLLVDDGGLIVTANREELNGISLQGLFLGDLNMPLLKHLKEAGIYNSEHYVNVQALCTEVKNHWMNAGPRTHFLPNPFMLVGNLLLEIFSWADYFRYMIYSGILALLTTRSEAFSEWGMTRIGGREQCVMENTVYYFGETTTFSATMVCSNYTAE
ncbi:hypothetical protein SK128_019723, partial [Halocaridina rubra]